MESARTLDNLISSPNSFKDVTSRITESIHISHLQLVNRDGISSNNLEESDVKLNELISVKQELDVVDFPGIN